MLYWLLVIPVLGILILVHEWGHFLAARWMRVDILEFGIGFPPRMLTLGRRNGVLYTLNWIPIGGFVRLAGEVNAGVQGGLAEKKPWQRLIILATGSAMNLLLALAIFTGLAILPHKISKQGRIGVVGVAPGSAADRAGLQGRDIILAINGNPARDERAILELALNRGQETLLEVERDGRVLTLTVVPDLEPVHGADYLGVGVYLLEWPEAVLGQVTPGRPAHEAGLRAGDTVVSLNGHLVQDNLDFWETYFRLRDEGGPFLFVVRREGQVLPPITVHLPSSESEDQIIGIGWSSPKQEVQLPLPAALLQGAYDTADSIVLVPRIILAIFRGAVPVGELAGPIGIAQATAEVAQTNNVDGILRLTAMLSTNLFVVNLLPLPALDGGRIAFVLLEWLRGGRRIPHRWEAWIHTVGLVLLLGLLVFITIYDVKRLFSAGP